MKTITVSEAEYQMIVDSRAAERLYDKETGWKHLERRSIDQCGQDFSFNENDFYGDNDGGW
jgi:hypothetical protein